MSVDTEIRFEASFKSKIADEYGYYTIYFDKNETFRDISRYSTGPVIILRTEVFEDDSMSDEIPVRSYNEEGLFVLQFFDKASGKRSFSTFYTRLRNAYRNNTINNRLDPAEGEEGTIYIRNITQRPTNDVPTVNSQLQWKRKDIFLPYNKIYTQ